jgi:hypothetical protein
VLAVNRSFLLLVLLLSQSQPPVSAAPSLPHLTKCKHDELILLLLIGLFFLGR